MAAAAVADSFNIIVSRIYSAADVLEIYVGVYDLIDPKSKPVTFLQFIYYIWPYTSELL